MDALKVHFFTFHLQLPGLHPELQISDPICGHPGLGWVAQTLKNKHFHIIIYIYSNRGEWLKAAISSCSCILLFLNIRGVYFSSKFEQASFYTTRSKNNNIATQTNTMLIYITFSSEFSSVSSLWDFALSTILSFPGAFKASLMLHTCLENEFKPTPFSRFSHFPSKECYE